MLWGLFLTNSSILPLTLPETSVRHGPKTLLKKVGTSLGSVLRRMCPNPTFTPIFIPFMESHRRLHGGQQDSEDRLVTRPFPPNGSLVSTRDKRSGTVIVQLSDRESSWGRMGGDSYRRHFDSV